MTVKSRLNEKMREGVAAVLPIALIVMVLCFTITPIPNDLMLSFVIGTVMLIVGMGLFTYGADASMTPLAYLTDNTTPESGIPAPRPRPVPSLSPCPFLLWRD